jgi:hypothetical protein
MIALASLILPLAIGWVWTEISGALQSAGTPSHRRGIRATVSRRACAQVAPAVWLLGATADDQAGSGRCEATPQMGALHVPESK